jgi:uncharacterized protein
MLPTVTAARRLLLLTSTASARRNSHSHSHLRRREYAPSRPRTFLPSSWFFSFEKSPLRPHNRGVTMAATTNDAETAAASASIVASAEAFVREELSGMDGSHDWWHIHRVRQLALSLATEENLPPASIEIVELAALLHDVRDWKYSSDVNAGADAVSTWLALQQYPMDKAAIIVHIISRMGFKEELSKARGSENGAAVVLLPEFKVVQDADRLDAIGAIGIGRTFCYGGATGDPMHVPGVEPREKLTKEQYISGGGGGGRGGGGGGGGGELEVGLHSLPGGVTGLVTWTTILAVID